MKSNFEERRQNRIEAYHDLSEKNKKESQAQYERSNKLAQMIPFGQPILVDHYSAKRHRADLKRIHRAMDKSCEASAKSEYYANKAVAAESNTAIFSDDPEALTKLKEKLAELEQLQVHMKAVNKLVRKNDVKGLADLGYDESKIAAFMKGDYCGRKGFPDYALTNNNANIRRLKKRVQEESVKAVQKTTEYVFGDVKVIDNVEDNRIQIFFPGKPSEEIRTQLKRNGFRWAPSVGAWMRHRSVNNRYIIAEIEKIVGEEK